MWQKPIVIATLAGSACGALILGVGGRVAMRGYALLDEQTPYFTLLGSATVVLIAAVAGAVTGLLLWVCQRLLATNAVARQLLFWIGFALLTARILQPLSLQRIEVFGPLAILHGIVLSAVLRKSRFTSAAPLERQRSQTA